MASFKAIKTFSSLKGVAETVRNCLQISLCYASELFALLKRQRPLKVAELRAATQEPSGHDEAVEATGRAIVLETQANPERSPVIRYELLRGPLEGDADY